MRRDLVACFAVFAVVATGFACGSANSELYAVMPSEPEPPASSSQPKPARSAPLPEAQAAPQVPLEEKTAEEGADEESAMVGLLGTGVGGLGLSGVGDPGTGSPWGTTIGTWRSGTSSGQPPQAQGGQADVKGRLPPEVVRRIVRQHLGKMRLCYERALTTKPNLQGRVSVRFVIAPDGRVRSASNAGSDLPDPAVVACVTAAFGALSFPRPEGGGVVVVTYPIVFRPGTPAAPVPPAAPAP
jgi:hypothetical protein